MSFVKLGLFITIIFGPSFAWASQTIVLPRPVSQSLSEWNSCSDSILAEVQKATSQKHIDDTSNLGFSEWFKNPKRQCIVIAPSLLAGTEKYYYLTYKLLTDEEILEFPHENGYLDTSYPRILVFLARNKEVDDAEIQFTAKQVFFWDAGWLYPPEFDNKGKKEIVTIQYGTGNKDGATATLKLR